MRISAWQNAQVGRGDRRRKKSKDGRRKKNKTGATAQVMLALIKGVVDVGMVLSLKPILRNWLLCLSFKLDVLTT